MKLEIREAILERDVSTFLSMNPKYVINFKEERYEGDPAYDGGKNPQWSAEHILDVGPDPEAAGEFTVTLLDDEDLICQKVCIISEFAKEGEENWYEFEYEGENVGRVRIFSQYEAPPAPEPEEAPAE